MNVNKFIVYSLANIFRTPPTTTQHNFSSKSTFANRRVPQIDELPITTIHINHLSYAKKAMIWINSSELWVVSELDLDRIQHLRFSLTEVKQAMTTSHLTVTIDLLAYFNMKYVTNSYKNEFLKIWIVKNAIFRPLNVRFLLKVTKSGNLVKSLSNVSRFINFIYNYEMLLSWNLFNVSPSPPKSVKSCLKSMFIAFLFSQIRNWMKRHEHN